MKKALFVALWVAIGITAVAQVTLSFNPEKGEKYNYRMEMIQKISQNIMGQQMDMNQTMTIEYDMSIISKTATAIDAELKYTNVLYNMSSAMMNMKYDSKNPPASATGMDVIMEKVLGSLLNKKFNVTIQKDGSVTAVTGMEAIMKDMINAVGTDDAMAQQIAESMKGQFSDDAMRETVEQSFKIYPAGSIKTGDTWTVTQVVGQTGMEMNVNTTYKLNSITGGKAIADINSTVDGMDGQLSGTQTGTVEFDIKSGVPVASKIVQKIKGTVSAQGMEMPMDITSNVNVTVIKE